MELKIPPAIIFLACGGIMWGIDYLTGDHLGFQVIDWLPAFFFVLAAVVGICGLIEFYRHKTTVDPHTPEKSSTLVTSGIYRITRNPMYLALLFGLIGLGFKLGNGGSFVVLPFFVWYLNRFQIVPEEKILRAKFGNQFRNYASRVRRWI